MWKCSGFTIYEGLKNSNVKLINYDKLATIHQGLIKKTSFLECLKYITHNHILNDPSSCGS